MASNKTTNYIGRFSPSPTGSLHMGSLVCALASYLDAKAQNGTWLLRIEDIDPPREETGASYRIIECLSAHGMIPDENPLWQHTRLAAYQVAIDELLIEKKAFLCTCTRKKIASEGGKHSSECRNKKTSVDAEFAVRVIVDPAPNVTFIDNIQGLQSQNLYDEIGDFIIKRKDGLIAYQLAVAIDDAYQNISHVVRGSDLLDSTLRQIHLQKLLQLPTPEYAHIPIIVHSDGHKLSKQTHATELAASKARENLQIALRLLGQKPPKHYQTVDDILQWSIENWHLDNITQSLSILFTNS